MNGQLLCWISGIRDLAGPVTFAVLIGSNKVVGLAWWSAVLFLLGALEAAARSVGRLSRRPPSIVDLVGRYLRHPVARSAAIAVWLFAGWHLFSH